jgi:CBS domain-containing protein
MTREAVQAARRMSVLTCVNRLEIGPLLAHAGDDLLDVARRCSRHPETRVVGVVDEGERLVGILPILRIVEDVIVRVDPEALMAGITDVEGVARFSHALEARTAGDAMLPPASVGTNAMVGEAFRVMQQRRLSGLYVIDTEAHVVGYLDVLELAMLYVEVLEPEQGQSGDVQQASPEFS